jgi:RimJ/RimL family protein N-acetyltransferase
MPNTRELFWHARSNRPQNRIHAGRVCYHSLDLAIPRAYYNCVLMLTTARLRLRLWRDEDLPSFAALNSDPRVMQYMAKMLDRRESDASAERIRQSFARCGFGLWAVEVIGVADFIGFTGFSVPGFAAHSTPCVEIAWRLARDYWGYGYATEAASAARDYGFAHLGFKQIVAITVQANQRSRNVMERIGMTHSAEDDFEHPLLPQGHPLRLHVLYRLARQ